MSGKKMKYINEGADLSDTTSANLTTEMNGKLRDFSNGEVKNEKDKKLAPSVRLEKLMGHGRFQQFQIWVFAALVCFVGAFNSFQLMFSVTKKPTRCSLPKHIEKNFNFEDFVDWKNLTSECKIARFAEKCNSTSFATPIQVYESNCFNTSDQIDCTDAVGYIHERNATDSFWSLSSEYDWVCQKADYGANVLVARSVGVIVSTLIFMQLSDKWGRSAVLHLTNFIYIIFTVAAMFVSDNYYLFIAFIAIGSTFPPLGIRIAYTLVAEYCNDRGRSLLYISGWVWWVAGAAFLSFIAWASGNWFVYGIVVPLCNLVFIPFIWLTPESPRLLLTQGKVERSGQIIRDIIRINKKELPENFDKELEEIAKEISEEQTFGVLTLFKKKRMAAHTCLMCITWIVNDFFYLGGQMNVENLAGNQYVNFALVASTELPSVFVGEFLINRYGRRWSHVGCMLITTAFFCSAIAISSFDGLDHVVTGLAICARTVGNVGWFINWVQSVEIFPTCVRVSGMNFAAMMANVVTTATPYVVLLGSSDLRGMYSVFAGVGVVGTLATMLLPETFQEPLPECLEDVEHRKLHPFFSWKVWIKPESEKQGIDESEKDNA